ncbi:MAG: hypothetical protein JW787_00775 [Sedimentisphaerales bacterium]|nr:hypothetical protein [Sedimentisphaerales bacterium]
MKKRRINLNNIKWSHPMSIKELSQIFDVHRNTLSKWLRNQILCNRQISPRRWQIAEDDMPKDV